MPILLDDTAIQELISEEKVLRVRINVLMQLKTRSGHSGNEIELTGSKGNSFRLMLRRSNINSMDFSVILGVYLVKTNELFRLRRYNGKSHVHGNRIEGNSFYDFHIHEATERYQVIGAREDTFAQVTNRYTDLLTATRCLLDDCNFSFPEKNQLNLFATNL